MATAASWLLGNYEKARRQLDEGRRERDVALHEKAFYGLAGDVVRTIEPHSEAARVALLVEGLVSFGNVIGLCAGMHIEGDFHPTTEFVVLTGDTANACKGTGSSRLRPGL